MARGSRPTLAAAPAPDQLAARSDFCSMSFVTIGSRGARISGAKPARILLARAFTSVGGSGPVVGTAVETIGCAASAPLVSGGPGGAAASAGTARGPSLGAVSAAPGVTGSGSIRAADPAFRSDGGSVRTISSASRGSRPGVRAGTFSTPGPNPPVGPPGSVGAVAVAGEVRPPGAATAPSEPARAPAVPAPRRGGLGWVAGWGRPVSSRSVEFAATPPRPGALRPSSDPRKP